MSSLTLAATMLAAASLAACSDGGNGPPVHATPTPTPTSTGTSMTATASGTVVDFASNTGLGGVTVAIAPGFSSSSTAPTPVTTTAASGAFTFVATPGSYLLVIGSNSASDTRATYHGEILLSAGQNAIAMGVPSPEPDVTFSSSQASGAYRLETLSSSQSSCLAGANSGRSANALPLMIPDQALLEIADSLNAEEVAQNTDTPSPLFGINFEPSTATAESTSANFNPCSLWTGTGYSYVSGNPPYPYATNPSNTLYGADLMPAAGSATYGAQLWGADPRPFPTFSTSERRHQPMRN
jgi:hypothetical protein